jgi:hypothetical protein
VLVLVLTALAIAYTAGTSQGASANVVSFKTVETGPTSGIREATWLAVRDAAAWTELWRRHVGTAARPAPAVDFEREMVIAVFAGESVWSNGLAIIRVVRDVDRLVVHYAMEDMKSLPISQAVVPAMPFHIVRIPRSTVPVWFSLMKSSK